MKKFAGVLGALALAITGAASIGCMFFFVDEPVAPKSLVD